MLASTARGEPVQVLTGAAEGERVARFVADSAAGDQDSSDPMPNVAPDDEESSEDGTGDGTGTPDAFGKAPPNTAPGCIFDRRPLELYV